jgi:hypothetical protein
MSLADLFAVHVSALELFVRGTVLYWFLFLLFRFVLRRDVGQLGVADMLLLVLMRTPRKTPWPAATTR